MHPEVGKKKKEDKLRHHLQHRHHDHHHQGGKAYSFVRAIKRWNGSINRPTHQRGTVNNLPDPSKWNGPPIIAITLLIASIMLTAAIPTKVPPIIHTHTPLTRPPLQPFCTNPSFYSFLADRLKGHRGGNPPFPTAMTSSYSFFYRLRRNVPKAQKLYRTAVMFIQEYMGQLSRYERKTISYDGAIRAYPDEQPASNDGAQELKELLKQLEVIALESDEGYQSIIDYRNMKIRQNEEFMIRCLGRVLTRADAVRSAKKFYRMQQDEIMALLDCIFSHTMVTDEQMAGHAALMSEQALDVLWPICIGLGFYTVMSVLAEYGAPQRFYIGDDNGPAHTGGCSISSLEHRLEEEIIMTISDPYGQEEVAVVPAGEPVLMFCQDHCCLNGMRFEEMRCMVEGTAVGPADTAAQLSSDAATLHVDIAEHVAAGGKKRDGMRNQKTGVYTADGEEIRTPP